MHNQEGQPCRWSTSALARVRCPAKSEAAFSEDGGRASNTAGMTCEACAQLFDRSRRAAAVVGAAGAAVFAGETQGLELAVDGAGTEAHGGFPCKVSLPLCPVYIAVQH